MIIRSRLWIIPPILLLSVVAIQPFLVKHFYLNKWKGGGFAMFSIVDHHSNRFLRSYVTTPNGEIPGLLSEWEAWRLRLIYMPNQSILQREARNKDSVVWSKVQVSEAGIGHIISYPDETEMQAIQRVYVEQGDTGVEQVYSEFLVPADQLQNPTKPISVTGPSRVDAFRLRYEGNGKIASELLSSSSDH